MDAKKLSATGLRSLAETLPDILRDHFCPTPSPEKLTIDLKKACLIRNTIQHRLAYQFLDNGKTVKATRMRPHYEEPAIKGPAYGFATGVSQSPHLRGLSSNDQKPFLKRDQDKNSCDGDEGLMIDGCFVTY